MFGENHSTCAKLHARWLFRLGAGGRSSDHEEAERTPRQNGHVWFFFFLGENKWRRRRGETRRGEERDEGDDNVEKMQESGAEVKRVMEQEQCRESGRGGWGRRREETWNDGVAERLSDKEREDTHTHSTRTHINTHTETGTQSPLDLERAASFKAEVLWSRRY